MTKWERQRKREQAKAKKAAKVRRADTKAVVKLLAKLVPGMKMTTRAQEDRANIVRKALDVLAGESTLP